MPRNNPLGYIMAGVGKMTSKATSAMPASVRSSGAKGLASARSSGAKGLAFAKSHKKAIGIGGLGAGGVVAASRTRRSGLDKTSGRPTGMYNY